MLRTIIIEDEIEAQKLLSNIIREYCPNVELTGICSTIKDGIPLLKKENPDLVFMDIELADGNSFEILEHLDNIPFKIIFTTAYDDYAIKAFKVEAVDYLLKPFSHLDVQSAINKVKSRNANKDVFHQLDQYFNGKASSKERLSIGTENGISIIEVDKIIRIEAEASYCIIVTEDQKNLVSKPLKSLEEEINNEDFIRVHMSHLVNIQHVKEFLKEDGGTVVLSNGDKVPISRRKKSDFIQRISNL